jgi:hypothetical protein
MQASTKQKRQRFEADTMFSRDTPEQNRLNVNYTHAGHSPFVTSHLEIIGYLGVVSIWLF